MLPKSYLLIGYINFNSMCYFSSFGRKMLKGERYEIKDPNVVHFFFREIGSPSNFRKVSQSSGQLLLKINKVNHTVKVKKKDYNAHVIGLPLG